MKFLFYLFLLPLLAQSQSVPPSDWKFHFDSAQFFWKKDINQSIYHLHHAERIAFNDLGIYDENYFAILNDLGLAYGQTKNYEKATDILQRKLSFQKEMYESGNSALLQTQSNVAAIVLRAGNDVLARQLYKDILNHSSDSANGTVYMRAIENLTRLHEANEHYDSALWTISAALKTIFIDSSAAPHYTLLLAQGRILRKQRKYAEATEFLTILQQDSKTLSLAGTHIENEVDVQLSLIDIEMGLYGKAEKELLTIYRRLKSSSDTEEALLSEVTNGLAYVYEKLGVYDNAMVYYQESLARCLPIHGYNSLNCMIIQSNIASVYLKQGLIIESIAEYERFVSGFKIFSTRNVTTYLIALNNLASAYRQNGQYEKALQQFSIVYQALEENNQLQSDLAALVMNNMAVTYTLKGEYPEAIAYFEKVLAIKEKLYGIESPILLDVIGNLAISYWAIQHHALALPLFKRSVALSQKEVKYIFPNLTETEQVQFYEQHKRNFERFNTLAINHADIQPELLVHMFNHQLLLKSLIFFTTKKRKTSILGKNDSHLKTQLDLVETKGIQLGHFYQMTLEELSVMNVSTLQLENEIDSLEKSIRHSLGNEEQNDVVVEWRDIQQALQEDEVLLDIIRFRKYDILADTARTTAKRVSIGFTDSVYYAALITSSETTHHPELVLLKNGNSLEGRFLNYYRNTLKFDVIDAISYSKFWQPLDSCVQGKRKIFIAADGVYHQINLNTLQDSNGKYLLEKYELHGLLNARQLVHNDKEETPPATIVLMAPIFDFQQVDSVRNTEYTRFGALPGSLEEVTSIVNLLTSKATRVTLLQRQLANETNFKRINSPSILHIATHGFFSSSFVYLNEQTKNSYLFHSGIILSPHHRKSKDIENSFDSDGIVTAYDVMTLDLTHTDLVVLSACETGLGKIATSEGVYGLQRSFLQAGARDLLISLWKVEDTMTKELMVKFYSYLTQHHSRRESFKRAQLDLLREVGNPRQWGGFVMVSGN